MSISRVFPAKGLITTVLNAQGVGLFYRAAAAGVTDTRVNVLVNNQTVGYMLPNEKFRLNAEFNNFQLQPVDTNNTAEFVIFDRDEDFQTAQVTGLIQVTNFPTLYQLADPSPVLPSVYPQTNNKQRIVTQSQGLNGATSSLIYFKNVSAGDFIIERINTNFQVASAATNVTTSISAVSAYSAFTAINNSWDPYAANSNNDVMGALVATIVSSSPIDYNNNRTSTYQPPSPIVVKSGGGVVVLVSLSVAGAAGDSFVSTVTGRKV